MRIIQVMRVLGFGGAENHVLTLSLGLRDRGHDVLVAARESSWIAEQCRQHGLPVEPLRMRGVGDVFSYWKLHRLIKSWRADIVHAHLPHPSQYAGIATMGTSAIPVSTAHSTVSSKRMRRCRKIIAVCDAVAENLVKDHYPREQITRIYNAVPDISGGDRTALRQELGIPEEQFTVVCAGRFQPDKGQDLLVQIARHCPENVHIYFMGDHETDFGQEVVKAAVGHSRIHFLGYRNDVQQILPAFDLYVAPSRREAFSLSILEAAAAGLPTVGMRVGGIPESLINGETGLLAPAGDIEKFADAIRQFSENPDLLEKMGKAARLRYEREFTLENLLTQTESVYRSLLTTA